MHVRVYQRRANVSIDMLRCADGRVESLRVLDIGSNDSSLGTSVEPSVRMVQEPIGTFDDISVAANGP
jgi:hypothetical protein